jgi:tetratricopeptide (TPR) repeat protein
MLELDLAELARERQAHAEAEGRYGRALASLPAADQTHRLIAHRGRGQVLYRSGRAAESLPDFEAARAAAQRLGDTETELEVLLEQAIALDWMNDAPGAAQLVSLAEAIEAKGGAVSRGARAALLVGQGRTLLRAGRWLEAWETLQRAVTGAEQLGVAGYDSLIVALILLEVLLPYLGRTPEAEAAAVRAITLARARGDLLNLGSAINNRRNLLVARKDLAGAIADQRAFLEISKQLGLSLGEYYAEFNIAELHYQSGDAEAAAPWAARAVSFEEKMPSIAPRPAALLLQARLLAFRGMLDEARALVARVNEAVAKAQLENRTAGLLPPSEAVLLSMVDLGTREASEGEWDALIARSEIDSIEQEPIEVWEMRARAARRSGRVEEARRCIDTARSLAGRVPTLFDARLREGYAAA